MLKLYGVPFSQPVRAVMWLLIMHKEAFELVLTNPGSKGENGTRHPDYLAKNPGGTIPCIEEADGFCLGEAHAIMVYLCEKHGWSDVYPDDLQQRARINMYLHYHHRNVRDASLGLVAPKVRKDLDIPQLMQDNARRTLTGALTSLNGGAFANHKFMLGDELTLADIAAYVEIGQCRPEFTNVYDFSDFPNVQRWLNDMAEIPGHDEVHVVMKELGDISEEAPSMDAIRSANIAALQTLKATLADF